LPIWYAVVITGHLSYGLKELNIKKIN